MRYAVAASLVLLLAAPAHADESQIQLREGPGKVLVQASCITCHSLDYIPMNSVFLDHAGWQKVVDKMIKVMGAPIRPEDVGPIVDYLAVAYGRPAG